MSMLQCPTCRKDLGLSGERLCCSCGFSLRMRDNIHELESQEDGAETLWYDEVYYRSTFYDNSDERISGIVYLARVRPGDRILDLGCGPGALAVRCALMGAQVFGADPSRAALRLSERRARMSGVRLELFEFDGRRLPFSDSFFDTIIMADVAEHIDDPSLSCLLDECHRMLRPGGRLVVHTAPSLEAIRICGLLRRLTFGAIDLHARLVTPEYEHLHIRYHSQNSIRSVLRRSGLSPIVWGRVKYLKNSWPRWLERSLGWLLADQVWALAFKGMPPALTFPEAPYLDAIDIPSELDMGSCEGLVIGSGFYEPEEGSFRWTEKDAVFYLRSDERSAGLTMQLSAPRPDIERKPLKLRVQVNGRDVRTFRLNDTGCKTIDIPGVIRPGLNKVRLSVDRTFTPCNWGINRDSRRLGIVVYRAGVRLTG